MIVRGKHYLTNELMDFYLDGGVIVEIKPSSNSTYDFGGESFLIAPGLIDIQVNGYKGRDFCGKILQVNDVHEICHLITEAGVTAFCPTITTNSPEIIKANLQTIARARKNMPGNCAEIIGIHLEGPYISPEAGPRGAHPVDFVKPPNWNEFTEFQTAAEGQIRVVTLAPELDGAIDFIRQLSANGVIAAIGHHQATAEVINEAVKAGAMLSTHLGNGAHSVLPRHPNYIWEQMANDRLWASIIVDGHHLPPSVVKVIYRAKGIDRLILVSDVVFPAGLPAGRYQFMGLNVDVCSDGAIRSSGTPYLAGSSLKLADAVGRFSKYTGVSIASAIRAVSVNPAKLLGVDKATGRLSVGQPANLSVFTVDQNPVLRCTIVHGEIAFEA